MVEGGEGVKERGRGGREGGDMEGGGEGEKENEGGIREEERERGGERERESQRNKNSTLTPPVPQWRGKCIVPWLELLRRGKVANLL